jgi:hypothetical protein
MKSFDRRDSVMQRRRSTRMFASVPSALVVLLASLGGADADALTIFSSDIVDGEVKAADLASSSVTSAKIASGAVTSAKIGSGAVTGAKLANGAVSNAKLSATAVTGAKTVDNSLTGADIDESTLEGVNAATLDGIRPEELVRVSGTSSSGSTALVACASGGVVYVTKSITVPWPGSVLAQGSVTAGATTASTLGFAARIERTSPSPLFSDYQEDHVPAPSGRANVAVTKVFQIEAGAHTFVLRVCGSSTISTIAGQLTFVYTASPPL